MNGAEESLEGPRAWRIGIDGDALRKPLTGVGQYVFRIAAELDELLPKAVFFVYSRLSAEALALPSARWQLRQEPFSRLRQLPSFVWLKTRGAHFARKDDLDVFWRVVLFIRVGLSQGTSS